MSKTKMPAVTPWFAGPRYRPCADRPGLYETTLDKKRTFWRWWDGKRWGACCKTAKGAVEATDRKPGGPRFWRGLEAPSQ